MSASSRDPGREAARGTLVAHGVLLPFVVAAWAASIAYEVLIGRRLDPVAYGTFETMIGVLAVPGVIAGGVQLLTARAAAAGSATGPAWRLGAVVGAAATLVVTALAPVLAHALRVPVAAVLAAAAITAVWVVLAGLRGIAQGRQRYVSLGVSFIVENGARLAGTALLAGMGFWGPLWAVLAGALAAAAGLLPELRVAPARPAGSVADPGRPGDLALYVAGGALNAALPVLPLLLLRPGLGTTAYAALAAMSLLGRAEGQVGGWLSFALYARLVASPAAHAGAVFAATARLAALAVAFVAGVIALAAPRILAVAFAGRYMAYLPSLRLFAFASIPVAVFAVWTTRVQAERDGRGLALLAGGLALELGAVALLSRFGIAAALAAQAACVLPLVAVQLRAGRTARAAPAPGV